ncbi:MAG: hydrogenase maturation protease [Sulfolobales archaeon]
MQYITSEEELSNKLAETLSGKEVNIICLGNELRGDDSVGIHICRELMRCGIRNVITCEDDPITCVYESLTERTASTLLIIDAIDLKIKPGTAVIADLDEVEEYLTPLSTHLLPLSTVTKLLKEVTKHDFNVLVLGIQVLRTDPDQSLSGDVLNTAQKVIKAITKIWTALSPLSRSVNTLNS